MKVARRGLHRIVPQQHLQPLQVHPGLQHMGGIGMAKGMCRDALAQPDALGGLPDDMAYAGRRIAAAGNAALEQVHQGPVDAVILPQQVNQRRGDAHLPRLLAFALLHPEHPATRVDISGLQVEHLAQAQSGAVKEREDSPVLDIGQGNHQGQGFLAG